MNTSIRIEGPATRTEVYLQAILDRLKHVDRKVNRLTHATLNCPNCGAPVDPNGDACAYCETGYWEEAEK